MDPAIQAGRQVDKVLLNHCLGESCARDHWHATLPFPAHSLDIAALKTLAAAYDHRGQASHRRPSLLLFTQTVVRCISSFHCASRLPRLVSQQQHNNLPIFKMYCCDDDSSRFNVCRTMYYDSVELVDNVWTKCFTLNSMPPVRYRMCSRAQNSRILL